MRKLTIRQKVMVYFALVMIVMAVLVMATFYVTFDLQIVHLSSSTLERAVKDSFDDIEAPGDWLEISNQFDLYVNDVTILVYGSEGTIILGHLPSGFPSHIPLRSDVHQNISSQDETWQVYDLLMTYPNEAEIWVRGIHSLSNSQIALRNVLNLMLIAVPALIVLSLVFGNLITKRAFAPIRKISQTAESISRDKDLSKRIALGTQRQDEVSQLAKTFDRMFERLEVAFNHEKRFTSDVSHELRTPISAIISQAEYGLSNDFPRDTYKECLQAILVQSRQMSSLVTQLLELSRTANDLHNLKREPINLAQLCEMVTDELADKAKEKNIRIMHKLDSSIELSLDQTQMMRAVINLVTNAIHYGSQDGFIMIDLHREKENVVLSVSDDGVGIPQEHIDRIFNRFYQVDPARSRSKMGSSGLGLTMVRQIIEAHGGLISVQSTENVGSTFTVILPGIRSER